MDNFIGKIRRYLSVWTKPNEDHLSLLCHIVVFLIFGFLLSRFLQLKHIYRFHAKKDYFSQHFDKLIRQNGRFPDKNVFLWCKTLSSSCIKLAQLAETGLGKNYRAARQEYSELSTAHAVQYSDEATRTNFGMKMLRIYHFALI